MLKVGGMYIIKFTGYWIVLNQFYDFTEPQGLSLGPMIFLFKFFDTRQKIFPSVGFFVKFLGLAPQKNFFSLRKKPQLGHSAVRATFWTIKLINYYTNSNIQIQIICLLKVFKAGNKN